MTPDFDLELDTPIPYRPVEPPPFSHEAVSRLLVPTTVLMLRGCRKDLLAALEGAPGVDMATAHAAAVQAADAIDRAIAILEGHL